MFQCNLFLLIIDIVTDRHISERCLLRVFAFIHFSITVCSTEPHFQRLHDLQRRSHKTFCTHVPSFLRQIRCPCLRSRMRSTWRRISPPRIFFNLRILSFPHEEFHSSNTILILTHLVKYVIEHLANYTSFFLPSRMRMASIIAVLRYRFNLRSKRRSSRRTLCILFILRFNSANPY